MTQDKQTAATTAAPQAFEICSREHAQELFAGHRSIAAARALPVTRAALRQLHEWTLAAAPPGLADDPWWLDLQTGTHTATALVYVAPQLPCFAGHFPGQPLLPGVVQLEWAVGLANRLWGEQFSAQNFAGLARLKFKAPVEPGVVLALTLHNAQPARAEHGRDNTGERTATLTITSAQATLTSARLHYRD